jgi:D-arabinonate dehydratase
LRITNLICEIYRWSRPNQITNGSNTYDDGVLLLLRVITDEGLTGHGWLGGTAAERPLEIFSSYIPFYHQRILNRNPEDSASIFADLEHEHIKTFGFSGAHAQLTGAINCALWDIKGQAANKPVHALLSGDNTPKKVRGYIAGGYYYGNDGEPEGLARLQEELRYNVETLKTHSVKIKIGNPSAGIEIDTKRVAASREAIGPNIELMVDVNCAFKNAETAIAYAKAIEPYDIFWLEEPFRPDAFDLHRQLTQATSIPIATGENMYTVPHFREFITQGSVHMVNADVAIMTGGYDAGMDVWKLAKEKGCHLAPHGCQELQCHYVAAADPDGGRLEIYPPHLDPEREKIFPVPFALDENGHASIPNEPGIGLIPNREALKPHLVYTNEG